MADKLIISLDLKAAAEAAGVSVRTLQYAIDNDYLVAHYVGERHGKPVIRPADLEAYIAASPTVRPTKAA